MNREKEDGAGFRYSKGLCNFKTVSFDFCTSNRGSTENQNNYTISLHLYFYTLKLVGMAHMKWKNHADIAWQKNNVSWDPSSVGEKLNNGFIIRFLIVDKAAQTV